MGKFATSVTEDNGTHFQVGKQHVGSVSHTLRHQLSHIMWDFLQYIHKSSAPR